VSRDGTRRLIEWTSAPVRNARRGVRHVVCVGVEVTARHAAEIALARSEGQLRQAHDLARIVSWQFDHATRRMEWTALAAPLLDGLPADLASNYRRCLALIPLADRRQVLTAYRRSILDRQSGRTEHRIRLPDGQAKWVEQRWDHDFDDDGLPLRSFGTLQDVTERRAQTHELQRFAHMVERVSQEIWLIDAARRIRYLNAAAARSLGYRREDLLGTLITDIDIRGDAAVEEVIRESRPRSPADCAHATLRVTHRARDGSLIPKEIRVTEVRIDGEVFGCAFAQDISARLRSEQESARKEAQLRATLNAYPGWVGAIDAGNRLIYVNDHFTRLVGLPEGDIVGRPLDEICGPEMAEDAYFSPT